MRLVTTLVAESLPTLQRQAAEAASPWVEVRLDHLPRLRPEDLRDVRKRVGRKAAIATCRGARDGGKFRGSEGEREALLRAALEAGFEAVDVEVDAPFRDGVLAAAKAAGAEAIVSRHDLLPASEARKVEEFFDEVPAGCVAKYAAEVRGPRDLPALVAVCGVARGRGGRFAVMGLGDASLRLLAPLLGCDLVYCAPPDGPAAAPGQLPAEVVARAHASLPRAPRVGARHRLVALLGDPVEHSLSPALQNAAFAERGDLLLYVALRTPRPRLKAQLAGLREAGFAGANVTAPLKEAVLPLLDKVDRRAEEAASANTLVARRGRVEGHTTDGEGALAALREAGAEPKGKAALVLGAGGTGRAVAHALADAGARVLVANRTPAKAKALARAVGGEAVAWRDAALSTVASRADLLLNCTSLGREGQASPLKAAWLRPGAAVLDAVYRPGGTPLLQAALRRGCTAIPGEAMLLHQGARAYKLWTGAAAPLGAMRTALLRAQEAP